jgi:acetyltransferase-like isoleucine patch superfamily enzyme
MRRHLPFVLFDALFLFFAVVVYGASAMIAVAVGQLVWRDVVWQKGLAIVVGYFAFLHAFVLVVSVVKRIVQPRLHVGYCDVGLNKKYFAWGLNSVFQGLFTTSFFDRQVHILFYLKYLYYRGMGMKLPFDVVIGTRAVIRQAELIELGSKVVLGEMCGLYGHVSPDGKRHFQGKIVIGDHSVVGAYALIGPDVVIGSKTLVGAHAKIGPMTRIGSGCTIGPDAVIPPRSTIPDRVRVLSAAVVVEGTTMNEGETWGGHPATRVSVEEGEKS